MEKSAKMKLCSTFRSLKTMQSRNVRHLVMIHLQSSCCEILKHYVESTSRGTLLNTPVIVSWDQCQVLVLHGEV